MNMSLVSMPRDSFRYSSHLHTHARGSLSKRICLWTFLILTFCEHIYRNEKCSSNLVLGLNNLKSKTREFVSFGVNAIMLQNKNMWSNYRWSFRRDSICHLPHKALRDAVNAGSMCLASSGFLQCKVINHVMFSTKCLAMMGSTLTRLDTCVARISQHLLPVMCISVLWKWWHS